MPGFTQRLYTQQPGRTQHITIMLALHGSEGKSGSEAERIGFSGLSGFSRILSGLSGGLPHSERVERVLSPVRCDRFQAGSVTAGRASTEPDDRV